MTYFLSLFEQHSYLILFAVIALELIALPISAEFFMSYAGFFIYEGKMNYFLAILITALAAIVAVSFTYWVGRIGGYRLIEKYGKYIHLGPERYEKMARWMETSGSKLLLVAYFVPGLRHVTGYISGTSNMPFRKFAIPAYLGAFLWSFAFLTLGKLLGPRWNDFHKLASHYFVFIVIGLVILVVLLFVYRFYKEPIKVFFLRGIQKMAPRLRTIRATEVFFIVLTAAFIGLSVLMLGLAQDYWHNEFTSFNEITVYVFNSLFGDEWHTFFSLILALQSYWLLGALVLLCAVIIRKKDENRFIEYTMLIVTVGGFFIYQPVIQQLLYHVPFLGHHSANFPDFHAGLLIIVYGMLIFLLIRHDSATRWQIIAPFIGLAVVLLLAVATIALGLKMPSDLAGGYVYAGVWLFFNLLLFEFIRLVKNTL